MFFQILIGHPSLAPALQLNHRGYGKDRGSVVGERDKNNHQENPIMPGSPEYGDSERLSSQERVAVAERLLKDASVNKIYVDDIAQCVADMVPKMEADQRHHFTHKIYTFINDSQNFNGPETFKIFNESFLYSLQENERIKLANSFRDGLQINHVTSCEAHLWGLVYVVPTLSTFDQKIYAQSVVLLARHGPLRDMVHDGLSQLIFALSRDQRTDTAYHAAENLKREESKDFKCFLVKVLQNVTNSLPEEDRILIADAVVPLIFDMDMPLVRQALEFFAKNTAMLPIRQRYPYALMISGLTNDTSLGYDARETLKQILPSIMAAQEKEQIQWIITQSEAGFSSSQMGAAAIEDDAFVPEPAYKNKD